MNKILTVAKYTLKENVSNKIFNGVLLFGGIVLLATQMLNEIALYEGERVIRDTGLFLIEIFVMLVTVYISATQVLKAQKEKSIYLVLTKSVSKEGYIAGSVVGMIYTVAFNVAAMGILLFMMMGGGDLGYLVSLIYIFYKLAIIVGVGVLFSEVSESFVTSIIFTISTYFMGHSLLDLKAIGEKLSGSVYGYIIDLLYLILPKYHLLNYRDYLAGAKIDYMMTSVYVGAYLAVITCLSSIIFSRKRL